MSNNLPPTTTAIPSVLVSLYGNLRDGRVVHEYTLKNVNGMRISVINYGGIVTSLCVPDRSGKSANVVLHLSSLAEYEDEKNQAHLGSLVGRCANRIAYGNFAIDGQVHQVDINDGDHSLHGGTQGFGRSFWDIEILPESNDGKIAIELSLCSSHGDQGYPGNLKVRVRYTLTAENSWQIDYDAQTDKPTLVNLTNHSYFNLAGTGSVLDHELTLNADRYAPVDVGLIPTGRADVTDTVFDFRQPRVLRELLSSGLANEPQFAFTRGFDHHFDLNRNHPTGLCHVARLSDQVSGRTMDVLSTEPGVQFYSGNFLDGSLLGAHGSPLKAGDGLCLETQQVPNAINDRSQKTQRPSTLLIPNERYTSSTVYCFSSLPLP